MTACWRLTSVSGRLMAFSDERPIKFSALRRRTAPYYTFDDFYIRHDDNIINY